MTPKPCFIKVLNCRKSVQFPQRWILGLTSRVVIMQNKMLSTKFEHLFDLITYSHCYSYILYYFLFTFFLHC